MLKLIEVDDVRGEIKLSFNGNQADDVEKWLLYINHIVDEETAGRLKIVRCDNCDKRVVISSEVNAPVVCNEECFKKAVANEGAA